MIRSPRMTTPGEGLGVPIDQRDFDLWRTAAGERGGGWEEGNLGARYIVVYARP